MTNATTSVRQSFAEQFGEDQAAAVEAAARGHGNGINNTNLGSDPFKWACLIAIGYQCVEIDDYREHHGITLPFDAFKTWCREHGQLGTHDGDCDYLAALAGSYNDFIPGLADASSDRPEA